MRVKFPSMMCTTLCGAVLVAFLSGCPKPPPNVSVALLVSPQMLEFGTDSNSLFLEVSKSYTSRPMAPFHVTANQDWISFSPSSGVSDGPSDKIRVLATIDRSKMDAGLNSARITITADSVVPVEVTATATQGLVADFSVSDVFPFTGEEIQFFDESALSSGAGPIISWMWDFGDGTTSTEQNPSKAYASAGVYTVSLTTMTATLSSSVTKTDLIMVSDPLPPVADFTASPTMAFVGQMVQFSDLSTAGSLPISSYLWDFGDGTMSTLVNPVKTYMSEGTYTVSLTVMSGLGSDTETKTDFIEVTQSDEPIPDFVGNPRDILEGDSVSFTNQTIPGSVPVQSVEWDFGDGGSSTQANPEHVYNTSGVYDVSLTVNTNLQSVTETKPDYITVRPLTALDRYVRANDPSTRFTLVSTSPPNAGVVTHFIDFVSQTWRSAADIYRIYDQPTREWRHKLTIVEPSSGSKQLSDTALLIVAGGSNRDGFPGDNEVGGLAAFSAITNSVVVQIDQVPNQPIFFTDMPGVGMSEDEIIAYSFDKFLNNPADETWPALLPMTKSVVNAMDVVQTFLDGRGVSVNNFVVTGASKRGWTTWLTAASDPEGRVSGLAPIVIDVLNSVPSLRRHFRAYNEFSPAVHDYVDFNIFPRLTSPAGMELMNMVDPYSYRARLQQPKYIINATGDEFFLPDSAEFYFSDLVGVKRLLYVPNSGHGVNPGVITGPLSAFHNSVARGSSLPTVNFTYEAPQRVVVTTNATPTEVLLWQAHDTTTGFRDFRQNFNLETTPIWSATPLTSQGNNTYVGEVVVPNTGWRGYYVQLTFPSPFGTPYEFTTELRVVPETLPFDNAPL
jgi:PhoPQ-activated pathogenicity-related protein/chitodextrinase